MSEPPGNATTITLDRLETGRSARIIGIHGHDPIRRRLLEMGLCPEVRVELLRRAPLGDPIELRVRGYLLSLRGDHARLVMVDAIQ